MNEITIVVPDWFLVFIAVSSVVSIILTAIKIRIRFLIYKLDVAKRIYDRDDRKAY